MFKKHFIFLFLFCFFLGRPCSLSRYHYCDNSGGKKCLLSQGHTFNDNSHDELPNLKKKYKTRAVQVILPSVDTFDFFKDYFFNTYITPEVQSTYVFKLGHVPLKRGPPFF